MLKEILLQPDGQSSSRNKFASYSKIPVKVPARGKKVNLITSLN